MVAGNRDRRHRRRPGYPGCVEALEQAQMSSPAFHPHLADAGDGDRPDRHRGGSEEERQGDEIVWRDVSVDHHGDRCR